MKFFLQTSTVITRETERCQSPRLSTAPITSRETRSSSNGSSSSMPFSPNSTSFRPMDSVFSNKNAQSSPVFNTSPVSSPMIRKETASPLHRSGSDNYAYSQQSLQSPRQSPHTPRRNSPSHYDRNPQGSVSYMDRSPSPISFDHTSRATSLHTSSAPQLHSSSKLLNPYDSIQMGRRSPRPDRSPSPLSFNYPVSSTLPRSLGFRQPGKYLSNNKAVNKYLWGNWTN